VREEKSVKAADDRRGPFINAQCCAASHERKATQLIAWCPACCTDYYTLLRFLRARNYMYDKAMKMWLDTLEWRKEYEVDSILENFVFHEREQFLMAYPQGYHKTDKLVCMARSSCG
jgi:hypothetical protein